MTDPKIIYVVLGKNKRIIKEDEKRLDVINKLVEDRGSMIAALRYLVDIYIRLGKAAGK